MNTIKAKAKGFTLTEQAVTIVMATIVVGGIGLVLADSQRGWNRMYTRVHGDVVTDAYVARKTFDFICRKSTITKGQLGSSGEFLEVYYYQDPNTSAELDRYARFYVAGEDLLVDHGLFDPGTGNTSISNTVKVAQNVKAAIFSAKGTCVQMVLRLDNDKEFMTLCCSAVRHNR